MYFLHRFAHNLTNYPFLFFSDETKLFLRSTSDFRQAVKALPKQVPEDILLKYGSQFRIDTQLVDKQVLEDSSPLVQSIQNLAPVITLLKRLLKIADENARIKLASGGLYSDYLYIYIYIYIYIGEICKHITEYESLNIMEYAEHDESKLILSKPPNDFTIVTLINSVINIIIEDIYIK